MMSSDTGLIHFDDVRVPQRNRIGEEGMGFTYQMHAVPGGAPLGRGAARSRACSHCIQLTIDYARERQIFGKTRARPPGACTSGSPS